MPTLLNYALTTEPFPLQASPATGPTNTAKLTVIASNPNPEQPVTLKKINIIVPIGPRASDLTNDEPADPIAPTYWKYNGKGKGEGSVEYRFIPEAGHKEVGEQGLYFVFNAIVVNRQSGICRIEIAETSTDEEVTVLHLAKFPHGWGEVAFGVDPANIQAGESTTLDWAGPSGATYSIEYYMPGKGVVKVPKTGQDPLKNEGSYPGTGEPPLTPEVTTNFTLHVRMNISGKIYHAPQQRTVTVIPRPASIEYFRPRDCKDSECVIYGDKFALEWNVLNAEPHQCQLTQEWTDSKGTQVTQVISMPWKDKFVVVTPTEKEVRYTLMVKDKSHEVTATVTATLIPAVPVGTIVPYGAIRADQLPAGWLYCNGSEYSRTRYPQLYPVIGELYGKSRTADNGVLPDLRGYFVRGYDDGKGVDPGRGMGTFQGDTFRSHTHGQKVTANPGHGVGVREDWTRDASKLGEYEQGVQTFPTGDIETRPKNMACYFVIYAGPPKPSGRSKEEKDKKDKRDKPKGKKGAARGRAGAGGRRGAR